MTYRDASNLYLRLMNYQTLIISGLLSLILMESNAQFVEYQETAGIHHFSRHQALMGGGAAFFDFDQDGDDDLYLTAGQDTDHFYINQGDGTFLRDTTAGFALTDEYYTTGVIAGDIDNDGFRDLFVTTWGNTNLEFAKNLLFHNEGDGTFREIWTHEEPEDLAFAMGATFLDYNLDGLLDIYVINYVERPEFVYDEDDNVIGFNHDCFSNTFYKNIGGGQFLRYTDETGLGDTGCALAVTASDYDNDNLPDIYIANDFGPFIQPNKLYRNKISGSFQNVSVSTKANVAMYGMGISIGDYDKDLDLDYYVTNFGRNVLLQNQDGVTFEDVTASAGIEDTWSLQDSLMAIGWGTAFFDADNDTDLDLYISNGYVPSPPFLPSQISQNDRFYLNNDDGTFSDATSAWGITNTFVSRGMAYSDIDNDGDLDVMSVVLNVPPALGTWETHLYQNTTDDLKNWTQLSLAGVTVNRDAFGSKIYLYAGGQILIREVSGGASHASHHSSRIHFGLDTLSRIDSIRIIWTGNKRVQTIHDPPINQILHITEDTLISSTEDISRWYEVIIYPVPASRELRFGSASGNLRIQQALLMDMQGRQRVMVKGTDLTSLQLPELEDGTFVLMLVTVEGIHYKKLVIHQSR
ncbi:MAG TPA: FG-GAP-like repeat-containing protein [Saprospiraceae bacterium]|nr:FG-GAP-like repeat-containing protein [Saprospiraceae bacterium]